jgi:hypothetical protein
MANARRPKFLLGFLLAPLLAALFFVIGEMYQLSRFRFFIPRIYMEHLLIAIPVSYVVSLIIGGPIVFVLHRLGMLSRLTVTLAAVLIGLAICVPTLLKWQFQDWEHLLAFGLIVGLSGGLSFAFLLFPPNSTVERDAKLPPI